ncbi:hypothetical protein KIPE111705_37080 [Kibdelosporangium persicum]|uniref:Uncharacterized protein n=1 Tax=Kibdelosporangium persicum TaxID=2698649 RepID=A0ABX2F3G4_9PSEU|nr:hypothetical protein [Kibdelosporangium persicum]NRN65876.1 hypothetical protein [Kibdelosporangium persicum]
MTSSTKENVLPGEDGAVRTIAGTTILPAPVEQPQEEREQVETQEHIHTPDCSGGCIHKGA